MLNQSSLLQKLLILSLPFGLAACSSHHNDAQKENHEQLITKNGSKIAIQYGGYVPFLGKNFSTDKTKMLRVIDRGHNAKAVVGDITASVLCSAVVPFGVFGGCISTHTREDLHGDDTPFENPAKTYAYSKYYALLKENISPEKVSDYTNIPIYFIPEESYLVYGDRDDYKLRVGFKIYIKYARVDGAFICAEEKNGITLAQWQANNYELAIKESHALFDRCFQRLGQDHFDNISKHLQDLKHQFL